MNDAVKAMLPYFNSLCEKVEALKTEASPMLACQALADAECVVAALQAYLFRVAMRS